MNNTEGNAKEPIQKTPFSEKEFTSPPNLAVQKPSMLPWWLWIFLATIVIALLWGSGGFYKGLMQEERSVDPFLKVTNREFSLFLWQFPSYMRVNASKKSGYLTGFLTTSENFSPADAEEYVVAPPDLIFLYHTWSRLLSQDDLPRPIAPEEFKRFLSQLPEWEPQNWKEAPEEYVQLVSSGDYMKSKNMQTLSSQALPKSVRIAFFGWKNYFLEGSEINNLKMTYEALLSFLEKHPTYNRSYWRNIAEVYGQKVGGLSYLSSLLTNAYTKDAEVPRDQLSSFLRVACYNAEQAANNR